jgi:hypothetical protein
VPSDATKLLFCNGAVFNGSRFLPAGPSVRAGTLLPGFIDAHLHSVFSGDHVCSPSVSPAGRTQSSATLAVRETDCLPTCAPRRMARSWPMWLAHSGGTGTVAWSSSPSCSTVAAGRLGRFRPTSVKMMLDGAAESHTAAMLEPYLDSARCQTDVDGLELIDPSHDRHRYCQRAAIAAARRVWRSAPAGRRGRLVEQNAIHRD